MAEKIGADPAWVPEMVTLPYAGFSPAVLWKNIRFVRRLKADVFHVTGDVHYTTLGLQKKKTVLTVHDCVFMYSSTGMKRWLQQQLLLKWPLRNTRRVTTVSEQTKKDIVRFGGCREDKITVIPNPITGKITLHVKPFSAERPVILFIGTTPNKNLERVITALKGIPCVLDIVGRLPEGTAGQLTAAGITYTNAFGLTDEEMGQKYAAADMILFPSTFEGFGLPIIEGQTAGRPVITSNLSPMKEVAGEGACLVDPFNPDAIREAVLKVIGDEKYRQELVGAGLVNSKKYGVGLIASRYLEVYDSIMQPTHVRNSRNH